MIYFFTCFAVTPYGALNFYFESEFHIASSSSLTMFKTASASKTSTKTVSNSIDNVVMLHFQVVISTFKGTVSRDFYRLFFFIKHLPLAVSMTRLSQIFFFRQPLFLTFCLTSLG
jgi:hypothetical protein